MSLCAPLQAWVSAITEAWLGCIKHTARGAHMPSREEALVMQEARLQAENVELRRSLAEAGQQRLRESTAQWQAAAAAAETVHKEVRGDQTEAVSWRLLVR
jgi:hypothetical protein